MSGHLSIEELLAEEDRLPVTFNVDVDGLGYLDPTSMRENLAQGTRVELPLWMALKLFKDGVVEVSLPKHYGQKMRDELSSSSTINLRDYSHYFFNAGIKIGHATRDRDLVQSLRASFCGDRFRGLMVQALTKDWHEDVTEYAQTLTVHELQVLRGGLEVSKELSRWRSGQGHLIQTSSIIAQESNTSLQPVAKRARK